MRLSPFLTVVLGSGLLALGGCATSGAPSQTLAGPHPQLSVERFLQAANTRDLASMAGIFGTSRGSIADRTGSSLGCAFKRMGSWIGLSRRCLSWQQIELRMNTIAHILRHDDYRMRSETRVAGRRFPTIRVGVDLVVGDQRHQDVPFTVVQTDGGRWLVEEIGLEAITAS